MDRRAWKNFIMKRSTVWTLSLCMTGAIVLGSIAAVNKSRQEDEVQVESEIGQMALLEEEHPDGLASDEAETGTVAEASGNTVEEEADHKETEQAESEGAADEPEQTAEAGDTSAVSASGEISGDDSTSAVSSDTVISEQALIDQGIAFSEAETLMWPSAGTILIDYSMDSSVYFPTLNQYKYNPALIIGSETGNQVLAAAKGIVESVSVDEVTGTTLVLNIGNGYKLTYGQLKELAASEGDIVEAGEVLGYVSEPTKYYSKEGSNLYFAMTKDEGAVDPVLFLE